MNKATKSLLGLAIGSAAVAYANNQIFSKAKTLTNELGGDGKFWRGPHGDIFYTCQGKGSAIVLVHGVYPGASAYEWKRNFDALSEHYKVFAIDLLGFGLSDKPGANLTSAMQIETLQAFLEQVVGGSSAVVACGESAAYAIQVASDSPELIKTLILSGPMHHDPRPQPVFAMFPTSLPLVLTTVWNISTSLAGLRYYLMNSVYFDPSHVDDDMVQYYSTATHQYGSQYVFPSLLAGRLRHDASDALRTMSQTSVHAIFGRESRLVPLSTAEQFRSLSPAAEITIFDRCGALPQDEQAQPFNRLVLSVLTSDGSFQTSRPRKTSPSTKAKQQPQEQDND